MKPDLGQTIQILTNIGVIAAILFLGLKFQQDNQKGETDSPQLTGNSTARYAKLVDASALKCPSSYDDETKRFRNENYWLLQKARDEDNISVVLRPDRDTGTWRIDVDTLNNPMTVTPDFYEWESMNYRDNYYVLSRKHLTMERRRTNRDTISSQCKLIDPGEARNAVESRYQQRLEGNRI